jgi:putative acetyltransferase
MSLEAVVIRREESSDAHDIRAVNKAAFGEPDEADLVERLRVEGAVLASFVAEHAQAIVGHILFSRMLIETDHDTVMTVALAPLAVLPAYHRQGIGSRLVRKGLDSLRSRGERLVLVLGEPQFYTRFGFSSAAARMLKTPFQPEFFMALELVRHALNDAHGTVCYPSAFKL